ncbi:hypothetical protein GS18_0208705 [Metabacillus indicus]|uniref:DUF2975 domain-containing protein n=1 Tax=Metabacillus indicus TaxID=246786 RepID=A0A084GZZ0_METID|nr:hypothetical protein GS18_0208705 [Metabacillus indicus]
MQNGNILFLKASVLLVGLAVFCLSFFWLPGLAELSAEQFPEFAYLKGIVLAGIYLTVIPFAIALQQAVHLLRLIEKRKAFSEAALTGLRRIKGCAWMIASIYAAGILLFIIIGILHPSLALVGGTIVLASLSIGFFADVLHAQLVHALECKYENEMTV